ncbi:MAG: hypothetical protein WDZ70_00275 [Candidatus Paceibacterota bacterium]
MKISHKILTTFIILTFSISIFAPPMAQRAEADFWDTVKDVGYAGFRGGLILDYCTDGAVGRGVEGALKAAGSGALDLLDDTELWGKATDLVDRFADSKAASFLGPIAGGLVQGLFGGSDVQQVEDPATKALAKKDQCYDALAQNLARGVLKTMSDETLEWVQRGLNGNPYFVQNWLTHKLYRTDERARQWLLDNESFQDICSVFKSDVALALQNHYYNTYSTPTGDINGIPIRERGLVEKIATTNNRYQCGLERALEQNRGNLTRFVEESFYYGGWEGWHALQSGPNTNPYAAYLDRSAELQSQIRFAEEEARLEVQAGGGFLSERKCSQPATAEQVNTDIAVENGFSVGTYYWAHPRNGEILKLARTTNGELYLGPGSGELETAPCFEEEVVTPAVIVNRMVQDIVTGDVRRTELADEMNEVMNDIDRLLFGGIIRKNLFEVQSEDFDVQANTIDSLRAQLRNALENAIDLEIRIRDEARAINTHSFNVNAYFGDISDETDYGSDGSTSLPSGIVDVDSLVSGVEICSISGSDNNTATQLIRDIEDVQEIDDEAEERTAANLSVLEEILEDVPTFSEERLITLIRQVRENSLPNADLHDESALELFESGGFDDFLENIIDLNAIALEHDCSGAAEPATPPTISGFSAVPVSPGTVEFQYSVSGAQSCILTSSPSVEGADGQPVQLGDNVRYTVTDVPEGTYTFALTCQIDGAKTTDSVGSVSVN